MKRRDWLLLLIALAASGCGQGKFVIARDVDNVDAMRELLVREIPFGLGLMDARKRMEANHFTCEELRGKRFATQSFTRENFDFLLCKRTDKADAGNVRCWQVALVLDGESVADIYADISYVGP